MSWRPIEKKMVFYDRPQHEHKYPADGKIEGARVTPPKEIQYPVSMCDDLNFSSFLILII